MKFSKKCYLHDQDTIFNNKYHLSFHENSNPLILNKLVNFLRSNKLGIDYEPSKSLLGGLVKTSASIEFACTLEILLEKIQLFKEEQNNATPEIPNLRQ
ncbi:MAG TPA: hypothetical protein PK657_10250 [Legionella sp.]|nr:hypothetical protein [Legionella sp.]